MYNPANGRFAGEDPIRAELNWYSYCNNNPIGRIGPWGTDSYFIYDPAMFADDGSVASDARFDEIIEAMMDECEQPLHIIPICPGQTDAYGNKGMSFEEAWNFLGADGINVDTVTILSHGSPNGGLYFPLNTQGQQNVSQSVISGLDSKTINYLALLGCNLGNPSNPNNVAQGFWDNNEINSMFAASGVTWHWMDAEGKHRKGEYIVSSDDPFYFWSKNQPTPQSIGTGRISIREIIAGKTSPPSATPKPPAPSTSNQSKKTTKSPVKKATNSNNKATFTKKYK